jgi:hypothetical protein
MGWRIEFCYLLSLAGKCAASTVVELPATEQKFIKIHKNSRAFSKFHIFSPLHQFFPTIIHLPQAHLKRKMPLFNLQPEHISSIPILPY